MKKITLLLSLLLISFMGFQANAELWLIGQLSPDGWVTNKGVQFTDEGEGNYSLDLAVNATGQQYFSLTTQLSTAADDWDGIRSSRFGGRFEVALDTEVILDSATDDSPYINFGQTGTYTFNFNINTKVLKVSLKEEIVVPPFTGTIYVTKNSVGNIYAWDADGNYGEWPGTPVSSLETATLDGVDYYTFTYAHASTGPGLIFNEGMDLPQTDDMVPQDGAIYEYLGGTTASIVDPVKPVVPTDLFLVGSFNEWDPITAEQMTLAEDGKYTIEKAFENGAELKFITMQADWEAEGQTVYGAVSEGNFVFDAQYLGQELDITSPGQNFQLPAGNYTITVDLTAGKVVFSGEIIKPVVETGMFMVGKFNNWDAANPLALEQQEDGTFVANITFDTDLWNDFKFVTDNSGWETTTVLGADNEGSDYYTVEPELFDWPLNLVSPGANFRVPAGIYTITVAPALREEEEGYTVTISGQTITPETHIYVLGEIDGKTSADWTPYEGLEMTTDDYLHFSADITTTNDKNYFNFTKKLATDYDVEDGGWSQIAGYRFGAVADGTEFVVMPDQMGMPLSLGEDCDEPISFMLPAGQWNLQIDLESRTLTITGDYVMPETHVYILGEIDGKTSADWTPYEGLEMTTEDYIHFEANIATTNEINYFNFTKVLATDYDVEDGGWGQLAGNRFGAVTEGGFADPFVVTAEQMGLPLSLSQDCDEPTSFALPAGDWHLSLDLMARTLTITGDFPVPETHVYILGEVNDNGGWFPNVGTEMATDDYITFTANITTAGENWNEELMQGYSYFSFSKALAVNDADNGGWEEIGLMRFGAVVDDEMATSMLVTDDMLGYTLPVTNDGEGTAAFMLPAGEWKLTLNLADRTLIIDKAGLLGDVNGDGEVSIADITMLVDLVSNLNSNERSDVNGDGETSIADVTMLVDLVMGNSGL